MRNVLMTGLTAAVFAALTSTATAQTVQPPFDDNYFVTDLGSIVDLPTPYGGVTFKFDDPNTMLIGGSANNSDAAIYAVPVERNCANHITGFAGPATFFATAANIDGGLTYGPDDVLFFTTFSNNNLGQILPGATEPAKIIDLSAAGVSSSTGTLNFVPAGFPGAGNLLIGSYNASSWYSTTIVPDGGGTFDLGPLTDQPNTGGGPEGIVHIAAGSPEFPTQQALISEYSANRVAAYEINADGAALPKTRRVFLTGLSGAEGAAIDPITGDFIFSTFGGGNRVIVVQGFNDPQPCDTDFDNDNDVDAADLAELLSSWGECPNCPADVTGDCEVGPDDLAVLLSIWGGC